MPTDSKRLTRFECFRDLSDDQCSAVAELTNEACFYPQTELFAEGAEGSRIYLLSDGEVEILYNIGEEGPTHVDTVGAGEILGCSSLLPPYVYTSSARSLSPIETLIIDSFALRKLMEEDCNLGFAIQGQLIQMLLDRIVDLRLEL